MSKIKQLIVAETFYSIQGEGSTTGCPAVFLRLGGCNLLCKSQSWVCDTIEVWQKGKPTDFQGVLSEELVSYLVNGAHLIITGGEPLMQQDKLIDYITYLHDSYAGLDQLYIEVETNGTVLPKKELEYYVDKWNVSFKLSSSGEPFSKRVNEIALRYFNDLMQADFKIVICNEGDAMELIQDFDYIRFSKVLLMPGGATQEELAVTRPLVVDLCKRLMFRYTDRLHIVTWNQKTGV